MADASRFVPKKYKTFHPYRDGLRSAFDGP
jgi:hypothetical protein